VYGRSHFFQLIYKETPVFPVPDCKPALQMLERLGMTTKISAPEIVRAARHLESVKADISSYAEGLKALFEHIKRLEGSALQQVAQGLRTLHIIPCKTKDGLTLKRLDTTFDADDALLVAPSPPSL